MTPSEYAPGQVWATGHSVFIVVGVEDVGGTTGLRKMWLLNASPQVTVKLPTYTEKRYNYIGTLDCLKLRDDFINILQGNAGTR